MIIKKDTNPIDEKPNMRGGTGTAQLRPILAGDDLPPNCRLFSLITLPVGASIGEHVHTGECELFYFLNDGQVLDDGERIDIKAGDAMRTGSTHSHSVINTGADELRFVAVIITD